MIRLGSFCSLGETARAPCLHDKILDFLLLPLSEAHSGAAPILVDELHAGHFECPTNGLESRATDLACSQSLNRGRSASRPNPEK
jgi:hypothetical protein